MPDSQTAGPFARGSFAALCGRVTDVSELSVLLLGLSVYCAIASCLLWVVWHLTRHLKRISSRVLLRSAAIAFLFSPTIFACGGASPVPFPLLVAGDVYVWMASLENPCGYQSLWNSTIVGVVFIVVGALHALISKIRVRGAAKTA